MNRLYVYPRSTSQEWEFSFCPTAPSWLVNWPEIQERYLWLQTLHGVPQDAIFHAEGDVLTHTCMVMDALINLAEWRDLAAEERSLLFAAALLHNIGKPSSTKRDEQGRISANGHARTGERLIRQMFWHENVPFAMREYIARLVRFHALPLQFLERPSPERVLFEASQSVQMKHLALLAEADIRGRICSNQAELLEQVILFREYCQELSCYEQPRQFHNAHSRFSYFQCDQQHQYDPAYNAYDDTRFEVVLMAGLPGVGKDTWIHEHLSDLTMISLDDIRDELKVSARQNQGQVIQLAKQRARELLRQQVPFVWNATNIVRMRRQELISLVAAYGGRVRIIYLDASFEDVLHRNRVRQQSVPDNVINDFMYRMEMPDLTEAHAVEWLCV